MSPSLREPLPRFSSRVVLRRLSPVDLPHFQAYRHDERLGRYQGWSPQPDSQAMAFLKEMSTAEFLRPGAWFQLGIGDRSTDALIGDIGLFVAADREHAQIGFTLRAQSQGCGIGTEAVREAIRIVFEYTPVARVVGITDTRNISAACLLERVGMRRVSTGSSVFRGAPCTEHTYALLRHDGG